jgi:cobalt-zinc-cadmium efflux system membrane fusion protein
MLANMPQFTAPLFVVSDPARLWIQIDATEVDLPRLQPGREFTFTSRAFPDQTFTGRVDKVSEFIDPTRAPSKCAARWTTRAACSKRKCL